ncbi:MAG: dTDP-4-dehydrorhamnose 3,5-epimerase family protein [Anaerolineae bacterium]
MIQGVEIKELVDHADERRVFREIIRATDGFFEEGFGQLSYARINPGVAVAWHVHKTQVDWWYVPIGTLKVVLHDSRENSPTAGQIDELILGPEYGHRVIKIPAGVAHGYKAIGGMTHLFYLTSSPYNPEEEGRIPHDDPAIGYDWAAEPAIR